MQRSDPIFRPTIKPIHMRHITLPILACAAIGSQAQNYLGNDPIWLVHSVCAVPSPCIATDSYNYSTIGDSVIAGTTWTKVVREGVVSYSWQSSPPVAPDCQDGAPYGLEWHGIYLVRQEGRQLRIWTEGVDQLLFDFDLDVGDPLPVSYTNWNTEVTVIAVDSVLIGDEMRTRFELNNGSAQYLIEGVGSSNGLFEPVGIVFECGYGLDCFGLGSQSFYPENWEGGCQIAMGLGASRTVDPLMVFPNPANEVVQLSGVRPGSVIQLLDPVGRLVMQAPYTHRALDVSGLSAGVYTLVAEGRSVRLSVLR